VEVRVNVVMNCEGLDNVRSSYSHDVVSPSHGLGGSKPGATTLLSAINAGEGAGRG
jgi:hypothetical protein